MSRKVVWVAPSGRVLAQRRFHADPECASLIGTPIATFEAGAYSARSAGYTLCRKCAWAYLNKKRPTCAQRNPDGKKCALMYLHLSDHYSPGGPRHEPVRWERKESEQYVVCGAVGVEFVCSLRRGHTGAHYNPHVANRW